MNPFTNRNPVDNENFIIVGYSLIYLALTAIALVLFLARCLVGWKSNWLSLVISSSVFGDIDRPFFRTCLLYFLFLGCNFVFPSLGLVSRMMWETNLISFFSFGIIQTLMAGFVFCPIFIFSLFSVQWEYLGSGSKPNLSLEEKQSYLSFAVRKALIFTASLILMNGISVWFWTQQLSIYNETQNALVTTIILNIVLFSFCVQRYQLTRRGQYRAEKLHLFFNEKAKHHAILKAHLDYYQPLLEFVERLSGLEQTNEEILQYLAERIDKSLSKIRSACVRNIEVIDKTLNEGEVVPLVPRNNLLNKCFIIVLSPVTSFNAVVSFLGVILSKYIVDEYWRQVWLFVTRLILDLNFVMYTLVVCPMMYCIIKDKHIWGNHMSFDCSADSPQPLASPFMRTSEISNKNPSITVQLLRKTNERGEDL